MADDVGVVKYSVGGRVPALGVRWEGGLCEGFLAGLLGARACLLLRAPHRFAVLRVAVIYFSCIGGWERASRPTYVLTYDLGVGARRGGGADWAMGGGGVVKLNAPTGSGRARGSSLYLAYLYFMRQRPGTSEVRLRNVEE